MTPHTSLSALSPHSDVRTFLDSVFRIVNADDVSKQLAFDLSALTTGTTRTLAIPDANGTVALLEREQTFTKLATFALGLTVAGAAFASRGVQDDATARALSLSGSGDRYVTVANSPTDPVIGTSAGALVIRSATGVLWNVAPTTSSSTLYFYNNTTGILAYFTGDNLKNLIIKALGTAAGISTGNGEQVRVEDPGSATNRYLRLRGSNGGDPSIATSAGRLWLDNTSVLINGGAGNALQYLDVYNGDTGASAGSILRFITSDAAGTGQTTGYVAKYKTGAMYIANNENSAAGLLALSTYATASVAFYTRNLTSLGLEIVDSGGVNARWAQILGSATGNPKIKPSGGNLVLGSGVALATTATDGYVMIPTCAGAPTGVPTNAGGGQLPLIYDTTNNKLYAYNGAWKATAALT